MKQVNGIRSRRSVLQWTIAALCWLLACPAWGQSTSVPEPRYRIVQNSLPIYATDLDSPAAGKSLIESVYLSWEWWNGEDGARRVILNCPATATAFNKPDFRQTEPPSAGAQDTVARSISATRIICSAYEGAPGWERCVGWSCGSPQAHWYTMGASCPAGWVFTSAGGGPRCECPAGQVLTKGSAGTWQCQASCTPSADNPDCWRGDASCPSGNPILPGTAVKVQTEVDYTGAGAHPLEFRRSFRSNGTRPYVEPGSWSHWVHNWGRRIEVHPTAGQPGRAWVVRDDASLRSYTTTGGTTWTAWQVGDRNVLTEQRNSAGTRTGFQYRLWADDSVEHYDTQGKLLKVVQRNGWTHTLTYSTTSTPIAIAPRAGLLISVRNHFGRQLKFTYDSLGRLAELLPPGAVSGAAPGLPTSPIRYAHNEPTSLGLGVAPANQPTSVTWQDGTTRRYHYDHPSRPGLLSGITDELGVRISRYHYSSTGVATRTEGPNGTHVVDVVQMGNTRTDVIDRSGAAPVTVTHTWQEVQGLVRPVAVSAPCPLCGTSQASTSYTATGEVARSVAHDGRVTFFSYDSKGRETERAVFGSAYGSATAKPALALAESVTSTTWHATRNLPLQRAEAGKITSYTYDSKGNLTQHSEQASTDITGAASFAAARTGSVFSKTRAYTTSGLQSAAAEAVDGATTRSWTFLYNASGDLTRMTATEAGATATADVTSTASGHLSRLAETNGALAVFGYGLRGQLLSAQLPDYTATFSHDARAYLQEVQFSTGQWLRVLYNAAGEATQLQDSSGLTQPIAALDPASGGTGTRMAASRPAPGKALSRLLANLPIRAAKAQTAATFSRGIVDGLARVGTGYAVPVNGPEGESGCNCQTAATQAAAWQQHVRNATAPGRLAAAAAQSVAEWVGGEGILIFSSAYRLRQNMCAHGIPKPPGCFHTHHIVHRNGFNRDAARQSRAILAAVGIEIDDWENGVFLTCDKHKNANNGDYDLAVLRDLGGLAIKTRATVTIMLRNIAFRLDQGTYQ